MIFLESSRNLTEYSQVDIRSVAQGKIENVSDEQIQRLIEILNPEKDLNLQQENIRTIVDQMEK